MSMMSVAWLRPRWLFSRRVAKALLWAVLIIAASVAANVAGIYLGVTLGPVIGGLIIHNLGWRSLFLVVGAVGLVNVALPLWKLRHLDWREPKRARFDILGSLIYGASLTAVLLGFSLLPDLTGVILVVQFAPALLG